MVGIWREARPQSVVVFSFYIFGALVVSLKDEMYACVLEIILANGGLWLVACRMPRARRTYLCDMEKRDDFFPSCDAVASIVVFVRGRGEEEGGEEEKAMPVFFLVYLR